MENNHDIEVHYGVLFSELQVNANCLFSYLSDIGSATTVLTNNEL